MQAYKIDIMEIQEHHLKGTGATALKSTDDKERYDTIILGRTYGDGITVRKDLKPEYQKVAEFV